MTWKRPWKKNSYLGQKKSKKQKRKPGPQGLISWAPCHPCSSNCPAGCQNGGTRLSKSQVSGTKKTCGAHNRTAVQRIDMKTKFQKPRTQFDSGKIDPNIHKPKPSQHSTATIPQPSCVIPRVGQAAEGGALKINVR